MDLCKCCPSAHQDIPLLTDLCSIGGNTEFLTDDIIAGLGETSLNWFEELTESYLADQQKKDGESSMPGDDSVGWSPCPRGGLFTFQVGGSSKPDAVTPITALLSLSDTSRDLQVHRSCECNAGDLDTDRLALVSIQWYKCRLFRKQWQTTVCKLVQESQKAKKILELTAMSCKGYATNSSPTRSKHLEYLCTDQLDITWTSAMATPQRSGNTSLSPNTPNSGDTSIVTTHLCSRKPKVFHRQLFSPVGASACDDSLTQILEASGDVDITVESERALVNEDEFESTLVSSIVTPPGFCDRGKGVYKHSTPVAGVVDSVTSKGSKTRKEIIFQQKSTEGSACAGNATDLDQFFAENLSLSTADMDVIDQCRTNDGDVSDHLAATAVNDLSGFMYIPEDKNIEDSLLLRKSSKKSKRLSSNSHIEAVLSTIFPSQVSPRSFEGESLSPDVSEKQKVGAKKADPCASEDQERGTLREDPHNLDHCASECQEGAVLKADLHSSRERMGRTELDLGTSPILEKVVFEENDSGRKVAMVKCDESLCQDKGAVIMDLNLCQQRVKNTLTAADSAEEEQTVFAGANICRQKADLEILDTFSSMGVNGKGSDKQLQRTCDHVLCLESDFAVEHKQLRQESEMIETTAGSNRVSRKRRRIDSGESSERGLQSGDTLGGELVGSRSSQQSFASQCVGDIQESFNDSTSHADSLKNSVENPIILQSIFKSSEKRKATVTKRVRFNLAMNSSLRIMKKTPKCLEFADGDSYDKVLPTDRTMSFTNSSPGMLDFCEKECYKLLSLSGSSDVVVRNDVWSTSSDISHSFQDSSSLVDLSLSVLENGCCSMTNDQDDSQNNSLTSSQIEEDAFRDECLEFPHFQYPSSSDSNSQTVLQGVKSLTSADTHDAEPMLVNENINGYDFDDSFQISPTFCSQILRCSQTAVHDELPVLATTPVSDISVQDVPIEQSCYVPNGVLGIGSVHDKFSGVHNTDLCSVNDAHYVENHGVGGYKSVEKEVDNKGVVERPSVGNVSDFSLDDGDDEMVCAAALQAESADDIQQVSSVEEMLCTQNELGLSGVTGVVGESIQHKLPVSVVTGVVGESIQHKLQVSVVTGVVGERVQTELDVCGVKEVVSDSSQGELDVSGVQEVVSDISQCEMFACGVMSPVEATSVRLSEPCHAAHSVTPVALLPPSSPLSTTSLVLSAASIPTAAESLVSSSSFQASVSFTSVPLKASSTAHGTLAATVLTASSLLTPPPPPPSAFTATSPAVIAPPPSVLIAQSSPSTVISPCVSAPAKSSLTSATTTSSAFSRPLASTTSACTSTSVTTTPPDSTASASTTTTVSTTPPASEITARPPVAIPDFPSGQSSLHIFRRRQKKFLYPNLKQTTPETFSIEEETAGSSAGRTSFSAQEPVGDAVGRDTNMNPGRVMLQELTHPASMLSEQLVRSRGAAGTMSVQSSDSVNAELGPPRKTGQLLGFAKFSDVFQMSNDKSTCDTSSTSSTVLPPVVTAVTIADSDNHSEARENPCVSSTELPGDINTTGYDMRKLIRSIPLQHAENQECPFHGSVDSPADNSHLKQTVVQTSATLVSTSDSASETDQLKQNSPGNTVFDQSVTFRASSSSYVKDEEDIDITSQMWSRTEFSQMQPRMSDNETDGWDLEDSLLEHAQYLGDDVDSCQTKVIHSPAIHDKSLGVASSVHLNELPPTEQSSCGKISSESHSESNTSLAVLNHSKLLRMHSEEDNLEGHLDSIFQGLKQQLKSQKPFVVPFLSKKNSGRSSTTPDWRMAENGNLKVNTSHDFLIQKRSDVCMKDYACTDLGAGSNISAILMINVPGIKSEHMAIPKEDVHMSSASDIHGVCSETTVIDPKPSLTSGTKGFSTASGKAIFISENAKHQALKLMQDSVTSNELDDLKDISREGCVAAGGECVSSFFVTPVQEPSSGWEAEKIADVTRCESYINSGLMTEYAEIISGSSTKVSVSSSSFPVAPSSLCMTSASLSSASSALPLTSGGLSLMSADLSVTSRSECVPDLTDLGRRNLVSYPSIDPKLSCIPPISIDVSSSVSPAVATSARVTDDHTSIHSVSRLDKTYKGFNPFKPPKLLHVSDKKSAQESLKLKESLKLRLSRVNSEGSKNCLDSILDDTQTAKESESVHVNDNKIVDDWEDDSSFRELILVDGATDCGGELHGTQDMCYDDAFRTFLDSTTDSGSTLPQQRPQGDNAGPLLPTLSDHQELGQETPQMRLRDGQVDIKRSYSSSTCHLIGQLESQILVQQSQDKKSMNFEDSSCLRETKSPKDIHNCVDNDNSCTGMLKGFVTARGGNVLVSETALLQAKKMLCTEESAENMPDFCVFEGKMLPATSFTHRPKKSVIHHGGDQPVADKWRRKDVDEQVMSTDNSISATNNCSDGSFKEVRGHQRLVSSNTADMKVAGRLASEIHAKTEMDSSTMTSGGGIDVSPSQITMITSERSDRMEPGTTDDHPSIGPGCKQRCFSDESCRKSNHSAASAQHDLEDPSPEVLLGSFACNEVEMALQNLNNKPTLCDEQCETDDKTQSPHMLASFSTSYQLHVPISKTALKNSASILNETVETSNKTRSSMILSDLSAASKLQVSVTENVSKKARNCLEEFGVANGVKEAINNFSTTASGSVVSETALENAHSLDVAQDADDVKDTMPVFSVGFSTARGSKVSVSEKALQHAKSFLGDAGDVKDMMPTTTVGFSTASGSKVSVSEKALQHAKSFLGDAGDVKDMMPTTTVGFSTASGSKVSVSEKALQHAKSFLGDAGDVKDMMPTMSVGFSTGSGSKVSVSEKALQHAKSFLGDTDAGDVKDVMPAMSVGFSTAHGSKVSVSEKALQHAKSFLTDAGDVKDMMPTMSVGFSTASGSKVSVSEKALQHAKSFLGDVGDNGDAKDVIPAVSVGFSTASGLKVSVSEKALQHAKSFLGDTDADDVKDVMPAMSVGFSTASGSKVSVSEKALQHAKSFMTDGDQPFDSSIQKPDMLPRTTSSGALPKLTPSMVNLRPQASGRLLQNAQNKCSNTLNQAAMENAGNSPQTLNSGFSTATGLNMYVSEEALRGAKDVLDSAEDSTSSFKAEASNSFKVPSKSLQSVDRLVKPVVCSGVSCATSLSYRQLAKKGPVAASASEQAMREDINDNSTKDVSNNKNMNNVAGLASSLSQTPPACVTRNSLAVGVRSDHISACQNHLISAQTQKIAAEGGSAPQVSTEPRLTSGCRWLQKKESQTPVRSSCEGFHFDRRKTKGRSLSAVLSKPFNSLEGTVPPAMRIFQPPDKKTKMCGDSSYTTTTTSSSATITCSTSHSGVIASNARSTSSFVSPSTSAPACKYSKMTYHNETLDSSNRSKHDLSHKKASVETTTGLGNSNEQFLCEDSNSGRLHSFVGVPNWSDAATEPSNSPGSNPSLNVAPGTVLVSQCSSIGHQPNSINDSTSHHNHIPLEVMLDESRMKQDAIIRNKRKRTVRPVCGRWLELRKRKETLKTFQSLGLNPETGLAREELLNHGLSDSCLEVNCLNAGNFRFDLRRFYPCLDASVLVGDGALLVPDKYGFSGAEEFYRALLTLDGVDPKLVDEAWVQNHYRWIVWKLAAYEVCFPGVFAGRSLTPEVVMLQLKYRYDREIDGCHRSSIKKILERDDTPCKRLILCVASVTKMLNGQFSVELTDGWYVIPGQLDDCLTQLVARKRIQPGDKIVTSGAELIGCVDGCSPLELKEGTVLKLHGNSTRPAPWYSRLGYCVPPSALCVPLRSLSPAGGLASCVDVVFCRKYPVMYMEKLQDGSSVFRTAEEEDRARQRHEDWFQMEGEKMYMSLQKEMEENIRVCRPGHGKKTHKDIKSLWSGQDLASALEEALNPEELQQSLSSSQMDRLVSYRQAEMDRRQQEINRRLQEVMADACKPRHVTPVVKFKVHGCCHSDVDGRSSCHLVVWRPGSEWMEVEEGKRYKLFNVSVSSGRGRSEHGKVALTATRQTRIQACPINDNLLDIVYSQRDAWSVSELLSGHPFEDEFDFVGVVIQVVAPLRSTGPTCVFAADKNRDILCIRFWANSLSSSLRPGQGFVASNLILSKSLQNSGCRSGQVSADARSDVTCVSTSARLSSRYSDQLTQVHNISKTKGFLSDLQTKLQVRGLSADTKHSIPGHLTCRSEDYHEDFPPEIVDKIFTPMSQEGPETGRQTALLDLWNQKTPVNKQSVTVPCSSLKQGSGPDTIQQSSLRCSSVVDTPRTAFTNSVTNSENTKNISHGQSVLCKDRHLPGKTDQGDVPSEKNKSLKRKHEDEELENSFSSDMISKRKSILRAKMSKLLAYERPAKLSTLPCGNSPASGREFKSPIAKKL